MKVSVSMWSLHREYRSGRMNVVDFIKWASTTNADGVELLDVFWKDQKSELPQVKEALAATGLKVGCYAVSNDFVKSDEDIRSEQVEIIRRGVDMAVELGAKVVRVFAGDLGSSTFEEARGWIVDGLKKAAAYAEKHDVVLALENHGKLAGRSDQVIGIIEDVGSEYLKSTIDCGNFLLVDEDPKDAIANLASYAAHVHFKDFRPYKEGDSESYESLSGKRYVGTIAGEGSVDLKRALTDLKAASYQGWLSVEFEGLEDEKLGTTKSINNLIETLKTL